MTPTEQYLTLCRGMMDAVEAQTEAINTAAALFSRAILAGRMVHVFGSGHSRIMVEELWPRYGSFPGFNPLVELSLTYHHAVTGSNGQRQAMFLENVSGLAVRILRNFHLDPRDAAFVISSSGCSVVSTEMGEAFRAANIPVVALVSLEHSEASETKRADGKKLQDFADVVLDTGAPKGDAGVRIDGLDTPVAPGSTVGGCAIVNCIKAEVARLLVEAGKPPRVLTAANVVGAERSRTLFEAAYDEHGARMAKLLHHPGALD